MKTFYAYHAVTERPMHIGQIITFDEEHKSGVYQRVMEKKEEVELLYKAPDAVDIHTLEHHTRVALRELALEEIRERYYSQYPSRLHCLYVSASPFEAEKWAELFLSLHRRVYAVVKLKITGNYFLGYANNCFDAVSNKETNLAMAHHYWKNLPNTVHTEPIQEMLVDGTIEVVEIYKQYQAADTAVISLVQPSEYEIVMEITRTTIQEIYPHYYSQGAVDYFLAHHKKEAILQDIQSKRVYLLYDEERTAVGTLTIKGNEICRLFVLPTKQKQGYGRRLMDFAEDMIFHKYTNCVLAASLSAKMLYKKRGYHEIAYHTIKTDNEDYLCYDVMEKTNPRSECK